MIVWLNALFIAYQVKIFQALLNQNPGVYASIILVYISEIKYINAKKL